MLWNLKYILKVNMYSLLFNKVLITLTALNPPDFSEILEDKINFSKYSDKINLDNSIKTNPDREYYICLPILRKNCIEDTTVADRNRKSEDRQDSGQ